MLTRPDVAGFGKWVIGLGVFWVVISFLAGREERSVRLGRDRIVKPVSGRSSGSRRRTPPRALAEELGGRLGIEVRGEHERI